MEFLMKPGIKMKRWIFLGFIGVVVLVLGVIEIISNKKLETTQDYSDELDRILSKISDEENDYSKDSTLDETQDFSNNGYPINFTQVKSRTGTFNQGWHVLDLDTSFNITNSKYAIAVRFIADNSENTATAAVEIVLLPELI